jgi:hypothetical protein
MGIRLTVAFAALVLWLPFAAEAQMLTTIEGHVFNKRTGVPLEHAAVTITIADQFGTEVGSGTGYTDSNGFYRQQVNTAYFVARIEVACGTPRGVVVSSVNPPDLGPEIVRRDAYLDAPPLRRFTTCTRAPMP